MNPQRLSVRFPLAAPLDDLEPAIAVFHRFIQRGLVEGLVLDVADYRHVPAGPGVMLIGHDVDYRLAGDALTVVRKRSADAAATQLTDALRMGLGAAAAIADDGDLPATVDPSRPTVTVIDRRLGPPDEVAHALAAEVGPAVADVYGPEAAVTASPPDDPRESSAVQIEAPTATVADVLERLGGGRAPGQSPWDVPVEELARLRDEQAHFVLLDVREESEYAEANLGGTLRPLATIGERLSELDREARILVHCRSGHRGAQAVGQLRDAGFDAWNVNGGLVAWTDRIDSGLRIG